jgi:hypothetical protein
MVMAFVGSPGAKVGVQILATELPSLVFAAPDSRPAA